MRTRMVLHEKGIDFEVHEVDLSNKSEEFLSVSPYGKVPVLRVNGTSLYESNIVREYLVGEYTLADIAHAGNFHRLGVLAKSGEVALEEYPRVGVWIERVESRESYEASV